MRSIDVLKRYFGYSAFRLEQEEVIDHILSKRDALVLMPTGGGKSLCYQIPAMIFEGITVVVSPLISLMKDQVDALKAAGVQAAFLNSSLSDDEQRDVVGRMKRGEIKIVYIAPERLMSGSFLLFIKSLNVSFFAIDESHCISQWGHDFRPEYLQLSAIRGHFPGVPVAALTASADVVTRNDIVEKLKIKDARQFISSFNRPNIHYFIEQKRNPYAMLSSYINRHREESGIVYALSRKSVEELAGRLREDGFSALSYHAGMDKGARNSHQERFIRDEVKIVVATIAFGMGIDKSNVRYVIHYDLPKNIESYYQETGRAGRDGLRSEAILYYSGSDVFKLKRLVEVEGNPEQTRIMHGKLNKMVDFCESRSCRRRQLLNYFGEDSPEYCGSCDVCLSRYELTDGTGIARKALAAVLQTGERFGIGYVVDILRGSKGERISAAHKGLNAYGSGLDTGAEDWRGYFRDLIGQGFLRQDGDKYLLLKLTEKGRKALEGGEGVTLVRPVERREASRGADESYERGLFDELRGIRAELAREANLPAYIILSDSALVELARYLPQDTDELRAISGFGEVKIERYGSTFLNAVREYCGSRGLKSLIHLKAPKRQRATTSGAAKDDTKEISLRMYKAGKTVDEISKERGLAPDTIMGHLSFYILQGSISVEELVPAEKVPAIGRAVSIHGTGSLGMLKRELGDGYSYGEIKAVINHLERMRL